MHNTFYMTAKGMDRAEQMLRQFGNPQPFDLHDACITFVATSGGWNEKHRGVTSEFVVNELDCVVPGLMYADTKGMMNQLIDEKLLTSFRLSRCKREPVYPQ